MQRFLRFVTTIGLGDDRNAARRLAQKEVHLHPLAAWRIGIVLAFFVAAIAAFVVSRRADVVGAVLAGGALVVTYVEWMLGRRESSMDKFYERLEIANEHRNKLPSADSGMSDADRYMFTELDNLEYVIERYRFGYMSPSLALRGLNTFESRFVIDGFEKDVDDVTKGGCAYNEHTCRVVQKMIRDRERASNLAESSLAM